MSSFKLFSKYLVGGARPLQGLVALLALMGVSPQVTAADELAQCTATSNIALAGIASQSSGFNGNRFPANLAIDGNLGNFTHTQRGQAPASWTLDLADDSVVGEIVLFNRFRRQSRLRDITVSILDNAGAIIFQTPLLNPENILGSPSQISIQVPDSIIGRRIEVLRTPDPDLSGGSGNAAEAMVLSLAEVQVIGCAVDASNFAPLAANDVYSVEFETELTVDVASGVLANDTDTDGDVLAATIETDVSNGSLELNSDGSFTYTPEVGFSGTDSFEYVANDGFVDSATVIVSLTVNDAPNAAPTVLADSYSTDFETQLTVDVVAGVLANDTDPDGDTLTATIETDVSNGSLVLDTDGSFTYTPDDGFSGTDSFDYVANDGTVDTPAVTVSLTVNEVLNAVPTVLADSYSTDFETQLTVNVASGVLTNDTDTDGDTLTATIETDVGNGSLVLNADGSFMYTPDAGFSGTDSFDYVANDGVVDSAAVTVSLTVGDAPDNTPVEPTPPPGTGPQIAQCTATSDIAVSGIASQSSTGSFPANLALDGNLFNFTHTLRGQEPASWALDLADDSIVSEIVLFNRFIRESRLRDITVSILDNAGTIVFQTPLLNPENILDSPSQINVQVPDDIIGRRIEVLRTPDPDLSGGSGNADEAMVLSLAEVQVFGCAVDSGNVAPLAASDDYTVEFETVLTIDVASGVLANDTDTDGDILTAIIETDVSNGSLVLDADGSFTYTPDVGFAGTDSFDYVASDGTVDAAAVTVSLTVNDAPNVEPVALADNYSTDFETPLTVDSVSGVLSNDTDANDDPLSAALDTSVSNGTLEFNADGSFIYTPNSSFSGVDSFDYVANDGTGDSVAVTVAITVSGALNTRPIAVADNYVTTSGTQLVVDIDSGLLANDTDSDGDTLTIVGNSNVADGTLSLSGNGSFNYIPDSGFIGTDSFDYTVSDGTDSSFAATVQITVGPSGGNSTIDVWYGLNQSIGNIGQPQTFANVIGNVSDPDGVASLSYSLNGGASQPLTLGPDGARLNVRGDFNVDLDRADLLEGNNQVEITAVDTLGSITSTTVTVDYSGSTNWPDAYQIDWSGVSSIQDAVEVIDGNWQLTTDGIRTIEPGYDRLLAVGDLDWDEYEVVSNFTIHDFDESETAGVGLLGPWTGHTEDPVELAGRQPISGFRPFGSVTWVAFLPPGGVSSRVQSGGFGTLRDRNNFDFSLEQKYNFRYRVERIPSGELLYSARVWIDGAAEPNVWNVQYTDVTTGLVDGSVLLIAHFADVTFGDVTVLPVTAEPIPVAVADTYSAIFETPLVVNAENGVLANDEPSGELTAILGSGVSSVGSSVTLNSDGSFSYVPAVGFSGLDTFTYFASDGQNNSFPVEVSLNVQGSVSGSDLLAYLPFDDNQSATIATDIGPLGNNGSISGATYVFESGNGSPSSLDFEGGDLVNLGGLDANGTGVTLAAWVKADSFTGLGLNGQIISKADGLPANDHVFALSTGRRGTSDAVLQGRVRIGGQTATFRASTGVLAAGEWYHAAMVHDGLTAKLYLDGVEVFSDTLIGAVDQDSGIDVSIGARADGTAPWDGLIDDVYIAQRAFSVAEIQTLATVAPANAFPVASNDTYNVEFDTQLAVGAVSGVLANDTDVDGDVLTAILSSNVSNGSLVLSVDGSFSYTPDSNFEGLDSFSYVANDGQNNSSPVDVSLNVQGSDADTDLLAHLPFDDSQSATIATDIGPLGNNGSISGATYVFESGDGSPSSLDFEGGDLVNLGGLDANGTGVTLAAWVKADSFTGLGLNGQIISKADGLPANDHVFALSTGRRGTADAVLQGRVRIGGQTATFRASTGVLAAGEWYHAAMVHDGLTAKLYLDGVEVFSDTLIGAVDQDSGIDVSIGARADGTAPWDGLIDDVYVAQRPFSAAEISTLATIAPPNTQPIAEADNYTIDFETPFITNAVSGVLANDTDAEGDTLTATIANDVTNGTLQLNADGSFNYSPAAGFQGVDSFDYRANDGTADSSVVTVTLNVRAPVVAGADVLVYLPFDDNQSATIATDIGPLGNNGSISGATYVFESGDGSPSSLDFEGGDLVNLGGLDANGSGVTLAAWVKADSFTGLGLNGQIISKADGLPANDHVFALSTGRRGTADAVLQGRVRIGGQTATFRASTGVLAAGEWYHAAMVHDGLTAKLYLDGVEVFSDTLIGSVDQDSGIDVSVGARADGTAPWDGLIDDVYVAQRPFSAAEISTLATVAPSDSINSVPVVTPDAYEIAFETTLLVDGVLGLFANDTDADGDALSATLVADVGNGTLALNADGSFTYTPDANFEGTDSFTYFANDGRADSAVVQVSLDVQGFVEPPDASVDTNLLAHLTLDDNQSPAIAADSGPLANDGVISGATYVLESGDGTPSSLDFEGGDLVNLGGLDANGTGLTLAAWVRADSFTGLGLNGQIISKADGLPANDHVFALSTGRLGTADVVLQGRLRIGGQTATFRANTGLMFPGFWYHTAMVYDGSTAKLYLNGVEVFSDTLIGVVDQDSNIDVSVGARPDGTAPWDGLIDDVRVAQRPFSAAEIAALAIASADNNIPIVANDTYEIEEQTQLVANAASGVLINDTDEDGDLLTAFLVTDVSNGTLVFNTDGSFTYTPANGFNGIDFFTYRAVDGTATSEQSATVLIQIGEPEFIAGDGVYDSDTEVSYREYWISHEWFTGNADCTVSPAPAGNLFFIEPLGTDSSSACSLFFDIEDDFSNAVRAEIYMDIWRGRANSSVRFNLNGGQTRTPDVGADWSRTPFVGDIPLDALVQGNNVLNLWRQGGAFHVHDVAIRIYHSTSNPLLDAGAPREAPEAFLVSVADDNKTVTDMSSGDVLTIDNDTLTLTAFAQGARYIEFHAFYDGYDEDNDGLSRDWHNRVRNNWNPGGTQPQGAGGTIDHIGTIAGSGARNYSIDWDISHLPAQTGVRFKVRVVNSRGDVRDAAGGSSAEFELRRETTNVETFYIADFENRPLRISNSPDNAEWSIDLPQDLSAYTEASIVASYWNNPLLSINGNADFAAFDADEDVWSLSVKDVPLSQLQGGANLLSYSHNNGVGEFIENPGPMIVLRGPAQTGPVIPVVTPAAPVAVSDSYEVVADSQLSVIASDGVLGNDSDANGDAITATLVTDVTDGTLILNPDGSFTYTPDPNVVGVVSFTYIATDGVLDSAAVRVNFDVQQATTPVEIGAPVVSFAEPADGAILPVGSSLSVEVNATDVDGIDNVRLSLNGDFVRQENFFPYEWNDSVLQNLAAGTYQLTAIVLGNDGQTTVETINVTVGAGNVAPLAVSDTYNVGFQTALAVNAASGVLANDSDANNDVLSATLISNVSSGSLELNEDGSFTYSPNSGFSGTDTFAYVAGDGSSNSAAVAVTLAVAANPNPQPPLAVTPDNYATDFETPLQVGSAAGVLANDTPASTLTATLASDVSNGILALAVNGSFTYIPDAGFDGTDSFTYIANNGTSNSAAVLVTITVSAPVTPVVPAGSPVVSFAEPLDNAFILEGSFLSVVVDADDPNGSIDNVRLSLNGTFVRQENVEAYEWGHRSRDEVLQNLPIGTHQLTAVALDNDGQSTTETITFAIVDEIPAEDNNTAPLAVNDSYATAFETSLQVGVVAGVLANDADADSDNLTVTLVGDVSNGILALLSNGSFSYTPAAGFEGIDIFTYVANDGTTNSEEVQSTITVNAPESVPNTNAPPIAVADSYQLDNTAGLVVDAANGVLSNDLDSDAGDILTAILDTDVSEGNLVLNPDGSFSYTPVIGSGGVATFSYFVTDGQADSPVVDVTLLVPGVTGDTDFLVHLELDDFQDSSNALDSGVLGNNGLISGAAYVAESGDGSIRSLEFDGNDQVDLGALDVSGSGLTVAAWVNADSFPGGARDPRIVSKASGGAANDHVFMLSTIRSGTNTVLRARVRVGGNTTTLIANTGALSTDEWHHAALVYDQFALKLFLNAEEVGSISLSGAVDQDPGISVAVGSQPAGDRGFDGTIDDVRILQRPYSEAELQAIVDGGIIQANSAPAANNDSYDVTAGQSANVAAADGVLLNDTDADGDGLNAILGIDVSNGVLNLSGDGSFVYTPNTGFAGSDSFTYLANDGTDSSATPATVNLSVTGEVIVSDFLAHLEFEDPQNPLMAVDSSPNGNFGAVSGADYVAETVDGSEFSMEFTGDDSIDLGNFDVAGTGVTLAAWINADTFPGNSRDPRIISKATGNSANAHVFMLSTIRLGSETVLRARIRVGTSTTTLIADSGTSLSTNTWHHASVTFNGSEIVLYLDGVEVGSRALSGIVAQDNSASVAVGSQPDGSRGFDGNIDDVRVLQRALTSAEINAIIDAASTSDGGAPTNLLAQAISDTEVQLTWTAVAGVSEYRVERDGVLIATVSDPNYTDTTAVAGVNYTYEVASINAAGDISVGAEIYAVNFASAQGDWWGSAWNYRLQAVVNSNGTARENNVANLSVDFDALISQAGGTGVHDASRVRCVEVTASGALVDEDIRCQSGDGELVLLLSGNTAATSTRYFHVYFDTVSGGEEDTRAPLVTLTENVIDEGFDSLAIETNAGSLNYHTNGAGFSSLVDNDGIDWISYNSAAGSRGDFRGIPNLVPPVSGGFFHPGRTTASTAIVDSGPIRVRIESQTDDSAWRVRWDVYPDYLAFSVLEKPAVNYWFLYEGTPGGALDVGDSTVRSTGTASTLNGLDSWGGDIPDEEWVTVNASEVPRSLFIAKQNDDTAFDSYRPASFTEGIMTVLGFGRSNADAQLTDTDDTFFLGFLETQDFAAARAAILSAVRELAVGVADPAVRP